MLIWCTQQMTNTLYCRSNSTLATSNNITAQYKSASWASVSEWKRKWAHSAPNTKQAKHVKRHRNCCSNVKYSTYAHQLTIRFECNSLFSSTKYLRVIYVIMIQSTQGNVMTSTNHSSCAYRFNRLFFYNVDCNTKLACRLKSTVFTAIFHCGVLIKYTTAAVRFQLARSRVIDYYET